MIPYFQTFRTFLGSNFPTSPRATGCTMDSRLSFSILRFRVDLRTPGLSPMRTVENLGPPSNTFSETASHRFPALLRTAKKKNTARISAHCVRTMMCNICFVQCHEGNEPRNNELTLQLDNRESICPFPILPVAAAGCTGIAAARLRVLKPCIGCDALADNLRKVEFNLLDYWLYVCFFHNERPHPPTPSPLNRGREWFAIKGQGFYLMLDIFI